MDDYPVFNGRQLITATLSTFIMAFWFLSISYLLHLLSTVIWLGGLATTVIVTLPAFRQQTLDDNQWLALQRRLVPWINASLAVLLVTGFYQMTQDTNYGGFMVLDGVWAWSMLFKHIAFGGLAAMTLYQQFALYPEMERVRLLARKNTAQFSALQGETRRKEIRLLWFNVGCAATILLFTALMTAI